MHSLASCEVDQVVGKSESAFMAWSPRGLRDARMRRCEELVGVYFRSWYFAPNSATRLCQICDMWTKVGGMPDHRAGKRHKDRRGAFLNLEEREG